MTNIVDINHREKQRQENALNVARQNVQAAYDAAPSGSTFLVITWFMLLRFNTANDNFKL